MVSPLYAGSGFLVGLLVGLTGVGGGSLMTPLLVLLFGIHPQTAVGTDLLYASITKSVGALVHGAERTVNWTVVGLLAAGSLPSAFLSVLVLSRLGAQSHAVSQLVSNALGFALFLTAISVLLRDRIRAFAERRGELSWRTRAILTVAVGLALGVLVTFSSVGAGAIGVTALVLLHPRLKTAEIVGSDVAHAVPLTLVAGLGHLWLGSINLPVLGSLLVGSIPGIILGSLGAARVPDVYLRPLLAAVLVIVSVRMVFV